MSEMGVDCYHEHKVVHYDHVECRQCGWVKPSVSVDGRPNNGWFPSMQAFYEWLRYKTYPGMDTATPRRYE